MRIWLIAKLVLFYSSAYCQNKPVIDTSVISKWPVLGNVKPIFSSTGKYIAYIVNNLPVNSNTLVVTNSSNNFKKEFETRNIDDNYFFCKDDRLFWRSGDTIFLYDVESAKLEFILDIASCKFPRLNKGQWVAFQQKNSSKVTLINLDSDKKHQFENIKDYNFSDRGNALLLITSKDFNNRTFLKWFDLPNEILTTIWGAGEAVNLGGLKFDRQGIQLSFLVDDRKSNNSLKSIWYFKDGMDSAVMKVSDKSLNIKNGYTLSNSPGSFSSNGKWLFFLVKEVEKKNILLSDLNNVDIWSYRDEELYPAQNSSARSIQGVVATDGTQVVFIEGKNERMITRISNVNSDYVIIKGQANREQIWWEKDEKFSYWLVSLKDGQRTLFINGTKNVLTNFSFSPNGKIIIYWNTEVGRYISYEIKTGKTNYITNNLPPISDENENGLSYTSVGPIAGWYSNDEAFLMYDRYDIWKIDPFGIKAAINITNGYGKRNHIKLRLVYENDESTNTLYTGKESLLLTGFNTLNKQNGFLRKTLLGQGDPEVLTMGPYTYYMVESQKAHGYSLDDGMQPAYKENGGKNSYIVKRQSTTEYPNFSYTTDLINFQALTHFEPQKSYNWITADLVTWKMYNGKMSQGLLYKPENFDPHKKYPVIFNYYIKLSHQLNQFPWPGYTFANINIAWFVSHGYLVFMPDIHYDIASQPGGKTSGEAAYNSVVSAAEFLSRRAYVDEKHMAIQGHSFGGFETNFLVTHSNMFAAASEMAGTADQLSAYLTLRGGSCFDDKDSRQLLDEYGGGKWPAMGANPWERPDLYRRNSAVLNANKVTAPVLIVHNKKDEVIPFRQGIEFYMALRRLDKECWLLQYDESSHELNEADGLDYTIRLTQFFDHFLKGAPAIKWMTETDLAKYKGIKNLYELDPAGKCSKNCKVCKTWNAKMTKDSVSTLMEIERKKQEEHWQ